MQFATPKSKGSIDKVTPNGDLLPKSSRSGMDVMKDDDDSEWEGFDTLDDGGDVHPDDTNINRGPPLKKASRDTELRTRKKKDSSHRTNNDKAGNSFKLLENAVEDEVDGIATSILCIKAATKLM